MPLPEEVHRRLAAVTDPDVASLLAIVTKPEENVGEPAPEQMTGENEEPVL